MVAAQPSSVYPLVDVTPSFLAAGCTGTASLVPAPSPTLTASPAPVLPAAPPVLGAIEAVITSFRAAPR